MELITKGRRSSSLLKSKSNVIREYDEWVELNKQLLHVYTRVICTKTFLVFSLSFY